MVSLLQEEKSTLQSENERLISEIRRLANSGIGKCVTTGCADNGSSPGGPLSGSTCNPSSGSADVGTTGSPDDFGLGAFYIVSMNTIPSCDDEVNPLLKLSGYG
ncbi:unnamed protein product [Protopolystoma xenopodis]|uniref:Uncharacterized protein n=1 Tax=Protopolystoma xenopodis TaxID=117903 RepID=A0A448XGV1_9PLAT|nr:unnamed protein product [Protopolystoma xenopodis]